ncbi:phenylacetate--CoA ligase family protein [Treponema sp. Marseille-Q4132]|uniref:phenylacetate--CoA ligase family protein n=1 Tax=Treponema sp. Marseille-Q4132 TaxID=2766701 RepID=UPI001652D3DA|nr:phenylacetate--CoA ligase family protein [Treponema sp. Marseille-Q4132]QNL97875.1 phenylacetate--CoA ligase family protein [Treponema sp. Marseille-Q4132]
MIDIPKMLIKRIIFPLALLFSGRKEWSRIYNESVAKPFRSYSTNISERNLLLYKLCTYAMEHVPYYKRLKDQLHIMLMPETIETGILQFPILTKKIIRTEGSNLYTDEPIPFDVDTSGGSTGEPVEIHRDRRLKLYDANTYFMTYGGYELGDKFLVLWGSERDIIKGTIGIRAKIINKFVRRSKFVNSFLLSDKGMEDCVALINRWKPKVIRAYVQSVYELAQYIDNNKVEVYSPKCIITSAGTLYPEWKLYIEKIFNCPVINQYGSREVDGIAIGCTFDNHLHCNMFTNYVEIANEKGERFPAGKDGNILVTNLLNYAMPLIRYEIGDVGVLESSTVCKCGRNTPLLRSVKGRTVHIFKTKDGKKIDGEYFTHLFYGKKWVKRFQVIQKSYEIIELHIELTNGYIEPNKEDIADIEEKIRLTMGKGCKILVMLEDIIQPLKSGKYLYTISEI